MDRAGRLGAVDCWGTVQRLSLTTTVYKVHFNITGSFVDISGLGMLQLNLLLVSQENHSDESVLMNVINAQGVQVSGQDQPRSATHLSHADWEVSGGSEGEAFAMCLYQDAPSTPAHLVLLHGCRMALYRVTSNSKMPILAPAVSAQRLSWDQAEDISLHDSSARNSAAGVASLDSGSATDSDGEVGIRRTKSGRPLSKLTSALRAELDLLVRCVSAPAQLAEVADSHRASGDRRQPQPLKSLSPQTPAAQDLSATPVGLRIKTGPRSVQGKHHSMTPRAPMPQDSSDLGQAINEITSAAVGSVSGQDRRVSFAEVDEVVDGAASAKDPPSPHPRKMGSGAAAIPQRSALKGASPVSRLSGSRASDAQQNSQDRVLITALRAIVSADTEQSAAVNAAVEAGAPGVRVPLSMPLAATEQAALASKDGSLISAHNVNNRDIKEGGQARPGGVGSAETSSAAHNAGALHAKVARLKAHWASMLKSPATATAKEVPRQKGSRQSLPEQATAQLIRAKSSSAPVLSRPSQVRQAASSGPVAESRTGGWVRPGAGSARVTSLLSFAGRRTVGAKQTEHAHGQASAVTQEPDSTKSRAGPPTTSVQEDECDSDWLSLADLWGLSVYVLPETHVPRDACLSSAASSTASSTSASAQVVASPGSMLSSSSPSSNRGAMPHLGPGPVGEAVEDGSDQDDTTLTTPPTSVSVTPMNERRASGEVTSQITEEEEEILTLDQQLSTDRPEPAARPGSSRLPRQVLEPDAEASGSSLDRYYSLPATLSLPPTVSVNAPLLQSRTSLLPGAWASGAFGDALDEFFLDSPTMLDSPVRLPQIFIDKGCEMESYC